MKLKIILGMTFAAFFMLGLTITALAQGEPPAPYAGMTNPFPWTDNAVQDAGMAIYRQQCLGCHGIAGDNLAQADFSTTAFSEDLVANPDFYFWVLSEGQGGMPGFKSSISEEQRWQILTYTSILSTIPSPEPTTPSAPEDIKGILRLSAPGQASAGRPLTLTATFEDEQGKRLAGIPVRFLLNVNLFITGFAEIGQSVTDEQGVASVEYTPTEQGQMEVVAQYGTNEGRANVDVTGGVEKTYEAEVGILFPQVDGPVFFPTSVLNPGETSNAPLSAFHLPGGIFSWMLILAATVFMIWFTYVRVMYQVFRIAAPNDPSGLNTRIVPMIGIALLITIGISLILMLVTGPWSHLHIPLT